MIKPCINIIKSVEMVIIIWEKSDFRVKFLAFYSPNKVIKLKYLLFGWNDFGVTNTKICKVDVFTALSNWPIHASCQTNFSVRAVSKEKYQK